MRRDTLGLLSLVGRIGPIRLRHAIIVTRENWFLGSVWVAPLFFASIS
jgi:hypothetical protein